MSRTTRRGSIAAATALTAGIVLAAPMAASAHVGVSPEELTAGDYGVLTFSFSHGCEGSPTTALRITMPEGLTSAAPTLDGDWVIDIERGDDALVSAVTYTAVSPVPNDMRGAVSMSVGLDENAPEALAFPVEQHCIEGTTEWTEIAEKGEDPHDLEAPAPLVAVVAGSEEHHASPEPIATEEEPVVLPTILSGAGLVAGVAALIVAALAYRRRA
ncbi:YcnI family protein [Microbacterium sp.]|uniref:YcnI family copper-binding membrane protein n=1 Tax=Microbacterium sp. TaxID=51671 RepID=UPI002810D7E7|nr:YcnI family protein [Microbacterium sp.]